MNPFKRKAKPTATPTPVEPIALSASTMDRVYDRSAGRWCGHCGAHGSHHTDRHNEFATYALELLSEHPAFDVRKGGMSALS